MTADEIPEGTPDTVVARAARPPRVPVFDPTLGIDVPRSFRGTPPHRLVALGDSLLQGFQSGAIYNTDVSVPAIVAHELGADLRYPRFGGPGGLPLNVEVLLRRIEERHGSTLQPWELPTALFTARGFMDEVEDYWERGPGATPPLVGYLHNLSCFGWDLRDALQKTARVCAERIATPRDDLVRQLVENNGERAALYVYPNTDDRRREMTLFDVAAELGAEHDGDTEAGIETLVVFLGSNNALQTVTELQVVWSGDDFRDLDAKQAYTIWRPEHFDSEFAEVVAKLRDIDARHVVLCTVPHVTIAPIARGSGRRTARRTSPTTPGRGWTRAASMRAATNTSPVRRPAWSTPRSTCSTRRSPKRSPTRDVPDWTGICSTPRASSTAWPRAATSTTSMRDPRGGSRTRYRRRSPRSTRYRTRVSCRPTVTAVATAGDCSPSTVCTRRRSPTGSSPRRSST